MENNSQKYQNQVKMLTEMGFEASKVIQALEKSQGSVELATSMLLSDVHGDNGKSAQSFHSTINNEPNEEDYQRASYKTSSHSTNMKQSADLKAQHHTFMSTYKTQECKKKHNHDKRQCTNWHTSADRRRNPFDIMYSPAECPEGLFCREYNTCLKSHNMLEKMFHPDLFKISMCVRGPNGSSCERGNLCAFAHSEEDLRQHIPRSHTYQTKATEQLSPSKTVVDSPALESIQDKLVDLIRSQGADGIISSELPKRYFDRYSGRLDLTDEAGEKFRIKDLLLSRKDISVIMHKGVQPKYVYTPYLGSSSELPTAALPPSPARPPPTSQAAGLAGAPSFLSVAGTGLQRQHESSHAQAAPPALAPRPIGMSPFPSYSSALGGTAASSSTAPPTHEIQPPTPPPGIDSTLTPPSTMQVHLDMSTPSSIAPGLSLVPSPLVQPVPQAQVWPRPRFSSGTAQLTDSTNVSQPSPPPTELSARPFSPIQEVSSSHTMPPLQLNASSPNSNQNFLDLSFEKVIGSGVIGGGRKRGPSDSYGLSGIALGLSTAPQRSSSPLPFSNNSLDGDLTSSLLASSGSGGLPALSSGPSQIEYLMTVINEKDKDIASKDLLIQTLKEHLRYFEAAAREAGTQKEAYMNELRSVREALNSKTALTESQRREIESARSEMQEKDVECLRVQALRDETADDLRKQSEKLVRCEGDLERARKTIDSLTLEVESSRARQGGQSGWSGLGNANTGGSYYPSQQTPYGYSDPNASYTQQLQMPPAPSYGVKPTPITNTNTTRGPQQSQAARSVGPPAVPSQHQAPSYAAIASASTSSRADGMRCGLSGCNKDGIYVCSGCNRIGYCGQEHQSEHWHIHKNDCRS